METKATDLTELFGSMVFMRDADAAVPLLQLLQRLERVH